MESLKFLYIKEVLPDTEHRFDHFHLIKALKDLARYLKNRRASAITHQIELLEQMEKAKQKGKGNTLSTKLTQASKEVSEAEALYNHVATLSSWLQFDILQLPGHNPADREELFDFVLEELSAVASASHRIQAPGIGEVLEKTEGSSSDRKSCIEPGVSGDRISALYHCPRCLGCVLCGPIRHTDTQLPHQSRRVGIPAGTLF